MALKQGAELSMFYWRTYHSPRVAMPWPQVLVQNSRHVIDVKMLVKALLVSRMAAPLNVILLLGGIVMALHNPLIHCSPSENLGCLGVRMSNPNPLAVGIEFMQDTLHAVLTRGMRTLDSSHAVGIGQQV